MRRPEETVYILLVTQHPMDTASIAQTIMQCPTFGALPLYVQSGLSDED